MTRVTIPEAQVRLPELLAAAEVGEGVELRASNGRTFRLVPASGCPDASVPDSLFLACAEDGAVPVMSQFEKPLNLLDPDAETLASFEP